jgi:hypothetical protein
MSNSFHMTLYLSEVGLFYQRFEFQIWARDL